MKRKICFVTVLALMIFTMMDCDGEKITQPTESAEASAELVVAGFMDDFISNGLGEYEEYFTEDCDFRYEFEKYTSVECLETDVRDILAKYKITVDDETLLSWTEKAQSKLYLNVDYTIVGIEADTDEADVTVAVEIPDVKALSDMRSTDMDLASMFFDTFGFEYTQTDALYTELAERRGKTVDELKTEYEPTNNEKLAADICTYFADELTNLYDVVLSRAFENPKTNMVTYEFEVEKVSDGQWKIDDIDTV